MYTGLHVKYRLLVSDCNETWIFSTDYRKILKFRISRKSVQCGWTDTTKVIISFHSFVKPRKHTWRGTVTKRGSLHTYPPMKMEQTECFETSAYKIQTPGNYSEESIQHSEQGESLKSRIILRCCFRLYVKLSSQSYRHII